MPRKLIILLLALAAACSEGATTDTQQALQLAEELREGYVAQNLELLMLLAERLAPLAEARDLNDLVNMAGGPGCGIVPGTLHKLDCVVALGAELITLHAELDYIGGDGFPTSDPALATSLRVYIDATGLDSLTEAILVCTPDPALGLVIEGSIGTLFPDSGCIVTATLGQVTAQRIADLPDGSTGLVFTSGGADLDVNDDAGRLATGSAALVGRTALVAIEVSGVFSQGEIALRP